MNPRIASLSSPTNWGTKWTSNVLEKKEWQQTISYKKLSMSFPFYNFHPSRRPQIALWLIETSKNALIVVERTKIYHRTSTFSQLKFLTLCTQIPLYIRMLNFYFNGGLNWNFMELKLRKIREALIHLLVWIEPLWNWNKVSTAVLCIFVSFELNLYGIETWHTCSPRWRSSVVWIEPLWNWNKCHPPVRVPVQCLNCTLMELELIVI